MRLPQADSSWVGSLFAQAPAFIAIARGPTHVFEHANPRYHQLVGFREIIGKPVAEALPEVVEQGLVKILDEVYASGRAFAADGMRVLLQCDPSAEPVERFVNFVYQPISDGDGSCSGIFCHGVDVTEQVRATEQLRASEARYRALFEEVPTGLYRTTPDGQVIDANRALVTLLGYGDLDAFRAIPLSSIYANLDDRERWRSAMLRDDVVNGFEVELVRSDGTRVWVRNSARVVRDEHGAVLHYEGAVEDITRNKMAERALREREEYFRTLIESGVEMVAVLNGDGTLRYTSGARGGAGGGGAGRWAAAERVRRRPSR
ncbi:MAG: PAS domain S-box protein [Gemmatimonadaceae bacterium]|nr:PAS domain S-box protein [Gemmatimonadaceae bacterium]